MSSSDCAKLRKTPKVYNALITTDEQLTPSKAYPLIQPVLQPIPLFSPIYPLSYADHYVPNAANNNNNNVEDKSEFKVSNKKILCFQVLEYFYYFLER